MRFGNFLIFGLYTQKEEKQPILSKDDTCVKSFSGL
jgi:hypothetical protein